MTPDQVMKYVPVEEVYAHAHRECVDLTAVVREVVRRSKAIDEGLDLLCTQTGVARAELNNLLNWFDVFEYAATHQIYLVDVMKYAVKTNAPHLLKKEEEELSSLDSADGKSSKTQIAVSKDAFEREMERLKKMKGIPDGKAMRSEQRETIQSRNRARKQNQNRGWFPFNVSSP